MRHRRGGRAPVRPRHRKHGADRFNRAVASPGTTSGKPSGGIPASPPFFFVFQPVTSVAARFHADGAARRRESVHMNDFASFGLSAELLRGIQDLGFVEPTPIQIQAIPPAMAGRDVLACAMTGSGKTAAFLLPILQRLSALPRGTTRALIVAPTRELAAQIDEHRRELSRFTRIDGAAVFGRVRMGPQEHAFRKKVDILVATPGRLLDHMRMPYARLDGLEVLVLDEADRMLDMGFLPDIKRILKQLPARRQNLLFSATMPPPIAVLAREILRGAVALQIERAPAPAVGVTHTVYPVPQELKSALFVELCKQPGTRSVLAFTRTKHRANRLAEYLAEHGVKADRIHGYPR